MTASVSLHAKPSRMACGKHRYYVGEVNPGQRLGVRSMTCPLGTRIVQCKHGIAEEAKGRHRWLETPGRISLICQGSSEDHE